MRKQLIFSLLAVLFFVPFFGLFVYPFLVCRISMENVILKEDEPFYMMAHKYDILGSADLIGWGIVGWIVFMLFLFWRFGFLYIPRWRNIKAAWANADSAAIGVRASYFIASATVIYTAFRVTGYILPTTPDYSDMRLLFDSEIDTSGAFGPVSMTALLVLPLIPLAIGIYSSASFLYLFVASENRQLLDKLKLPALGLMAYAISLSIICLVYAHFEVQKPLMEIQGISLHQESRSLAVLLEKPKIISLNAGFHNYLGEYGERTPFSKENEKALREYIDKGEGRWSRGACYEYLIQSAMRDLDNRKALRLEIEAFSKTRWELSVWMPFVMMKHYPAIDEYKNALEEITDEKRYVIYKRYALIASNAYAGFGDMEKARRWHERGVTTFREFYPKDIDKKELKKYELPKTQPFHTGVITGRLRKNTQFIQGTRVGLISATHADYMIEKDPSFSFSILRQHLTDGTTTDASGAFSFTGLPEGEYVLLLSVPGDGVAVDRSPGVIKIGKESPAVDVGTVRVTVTKIGG